MNITKISAPNFGAVAAKNTIKGFDKISHDYKSYSELIPTSLIQQKNDTKYVDEFVRTKNLILPETKPEARKIEFINEGTII